MAVFLSHGSWCIYVQEKQFINKMIFYLTSVVLHKTTQSDLEIFINFEAPSYENKFSLVYRDHWNISNTWGLIVHVVQIKTPNAVEDKIISNSKFLMLLFHHTMLENLMVLEG